VFSWYAIFQKAPAGSNAGAFAASRIERALATILPGSAEASFALASAAATGLLSIPTDGIPSKRAAKFVVPRPQNGSMTQSPRFPNSFNTRSGKCRGYIV
jgi:hypothetical protein